MKTSRLWSAILFLSLSASAFAKVDFEKEILPLINKSCVECHKAPYEKDGKIVKPKAGLRFDAAWAIIAGGDDGHILVPGDPDKSEMLSRTMLPEDDDDFMPPKGEKWTEADKKLVALWIKEGANFGAWEGNLEGKPVDTTKAEPVHVSNIQKRLEELAKGLKPASADNIKKVEAAGGRVAPLAIGNPLLRVDYLVERETLTDDKVAAIGAIKENLAEVDLSRTKITDAALANLKELPRLAKLDLHETAITDAGMAHLAGLENLVSLNLHSTKVTDSGLQQLAKLKGLQSLYVWNSQVTEAGAKQFAKLAPSVKVVVK